MMTDLTQFPLDGALGGKPCDEQYGGGRQPDGERNSKQHLLAGVLGGLVSPRMGEVRQAGTLYSVHYRAFKISVIDFMY